MPLSQSRQLEQATKLYKDFTGHDGKTIEDFPSPHGRPDTGTKFGKLDFLRVKFQDGKTRWIDFRGRGQPSIGASFDGRRLYILGGNYSEFVKGFSRGVDIGTIIALCYTTKRDNRVESYQHDFRPRSRPQLTLNKRGFLEITGGVFQFKDSGINDR